MLLLYQLFNWTPFRSDLSFFGKLTDFLLEFPFFFLPDFFVCNNFKILAMVSPPAEAERSVLDWEEILLLMLCYILFVGGFQGGY